VFFLHIKIGPQPWYQFHNATPGILYQDTPAFMGFVMIKVTRYHDLNKSFRKQHLLFT